MTITLELEQGYVLVDNTVKIPLYTCPELVLTRIQVLIEGIWENDFITEGDPRIEAIQNYLLSH